MRALLALQNIFYIFLQLSDKTELFFLVAVFYCLFYDEC